MQHVQNNGDDDRRPDCVRVPALGWWCRECGVFREVDDTDLCDDCRASAASRDAHPKREGRHGQR